MKFCKVTLTFDSADKILRCDHSNESSPPICFSKFHKTKFGNLVKICFRLNLAVKGLKPLYNGHLPLSPLAVVEMFNCNRWPM